MHDFYANIGRINSLVCHFPIEIYMFIYLNKSVFNYMYYTPTLTKPIHVLLHLFQLCQKYSGYFSDFLSLLPYCIFKK